MDSGIFVNIEQRYLAGSGEGAETANIAGDISTYRTETPLIFPLKVMISPVFNPSINLFSPSFLGVIYIQVPTVYSPRV